MFRKLLPLLLIPFGATMGGAIGHLMRPPPPAATESSPIALPPPTARSYVKLANQFVIPVMESGRVGSLVVLSLSLETAPAEAETVFAMEPKLRDEFLRVLFDHANAGGFRGTFTEGGRLAPLRRALLESAQRLLGPQGLTDVLITDIVRQDS